MRDVLQGLTQRGAALAQAGKLLTSLSYKSVLARGYAVIKDDEGNLVYQRDGLKPGTPWPSSSPMVPLARRLRAVRS